MCPTSYRTRHPFNFTTNEDITPKFQADLPHCVRNVTSYHVLEGATICVQTGLNPACHILERLCQYVRCHYLNFFGDVRFQGVFVSWFVFVNSPVWDIPLRSNQAASDRAGAVAKVPSKRRGRRKRTEFRPCWRVKCGMSLHPAEISNWDFLIVHLIYKGVEDFHICSCFDGFFEEGGTNYAPPGHYRHIPLHFSHNERTPVQISLQYLHWF